MYVYTILMVYGLLYFGKTARTAMCVCSNVILAINAVINAVNDWHYFTPVDSQWTSASMGTKSVHRLRRLKR